MQYTEYIKQQLKNTLSIPSPSGFTKKAAEYMMQELGSMGYKPYMTNKGCVCVDLGGEGHPILLGAHIDTLGGMVAEIKPPGGLRITRIGGLNANNVKGENCTISQGIQGAIPAFASLKTPRYTSTRLMTTQSAPLTR